MTRKSHPKASIVVPAFNVEVTIAETINALLAQTYTDFEIVIVDDGSSDLTKEIASDFCSDPRVRLICQPNRGLAGARNSGVAAAKGEYVGFCDADDLWHPTKLASHVIHLDRSPNVGLSFSGSALIDDDGKLTGHTQCPRLTNISRAYVFKRNPVGNGSAAVLRRSALDEIAFRPAHEKSRDWYFDETFRQSEDIECWLRLILTTDWDLEGVTGLLTRYRISSGGLSAATDRQFAAWERMVEKLTPLDPAFFKEQTPIARAYQYRYLSRRAVSGLDAERAVNFTRRWIKSSRRPILEEPIKSLISIVAAYVLSVFGQHTLKRAEAFLVRTK